MGGSIGAHNARAVERKHHRQVLQGHIVNQLVVGALQKGGINGHHGLQTLTGQTGRKSHRVLLGNAHIVVAGRETLVKRHHARAFAHRRRDAHQLGVGLGLVAQPLAKYLAKRGLGRCCAGLEAHFRVKFAWAMVGNGVGLSQFVALPFARDHMQKLRAL